MSGVRKIVLIAIHTFGFIFILISIWYQVRVSPGVLWLPLIVLLPIRPVIHLNTGLLYKGPSLVPIPDPGMEIL